MCKDELLDDSLQRLSSGETLASLLAAQPETEELRPLLALALQLRAIAPERPDPAFRAAARHRLGQMLAARHRHRAPVLRRWLPRLAAAMVALTIIAGSTLSTADASLPGSPLYPVKLAVEQVQLLATPDSTASSQLQLAFAERRLAELAGLQQAADDFQDVSAATERAISATAALDLTKQAEMWPRLVRLMERQQSVLEEALVQDGRATRGAAARALQVSQSGLRRASDAMSRLPSKGGELPASRAPERLTIGGEQSADEANVPGSAGQHGQGGTSAAGKEEGREPQTSRGQDRRSPAAQRDGAPGTAGASHATEPNAPGGRKHERPSLGRR